MPKLLLLIIVLIIIVLTAALTIVFNFNDPANSPPKIEIDTAVNQANLLYRQRKELRENFSNGPCLSNALMPGWVLDLVHNPRQPIDDLPENQCNSFVEGRSKHFVELDIEGDLIKAK